MTTKSRTTLLAVLCATSLMVSACSGSSGNAMAVASDDTDDTTAVDNTGSGADGTPSVSPLADVLGIPIEDDDAMAEYFSDLSGRAEVRIAECMLAQGFEYRVIDYSVLEALDADVDFESREFAEKYGFGIASNPFQESFEAMDFFEDPNQEYIENLTEGERDAYQLALKSVFADVSSGDVEAFEPGGCQGDAYDELFAFSRVFAQFGNAFAELEEAYNADPRVVNASSGWAECMGKAGYSFADVESAEADIERRYNAIVGDSYPIGNDQQDVTIDSESEGEAVFIGPQSFSPEVQADVDELAVDERAVAVASWDCNEPLRDIEDDVRLEYEQRFVDENGAAITALLDE